jgi:uncharacterized protein YraI
MVFAQSDERLLDNPEEEIMALRHLMIVGVFAAVLAMPAAASAATGHTTGSVNH